MKKSIVGFVALLVTLLVSAQAVSTNSNGQIIEVYTNGLGQVIETVVGYTGSATVTDYATYDLVSVDAVTTTSANGALGVVKGQMTYLTGQTTTTNTYFAPPYPTGKYFALTTLNTTSSFVLADSASFVSAGTTLSQYDVATFYAVNTNLAVCVSVQNN